MSLCRDCTVAAFVRAQRLWRLAERLPVVGRCLGRFRLWASPLAYSLLLPEKRRYWERRIEEVCRCPDNARIPRHPQAGRIVRGGLVMHNGVRVDPCGYYGEGNRRLLVRNCGVHEPQEEYVFQEVLKHMQPGSSMLELGAYWSFYSLWFFQRIADARCVMVEPNAVNLEYGRRNFILNQATGQFRRALVGRQSCPPSAGGGIETVCVDDLVSEYGIDRLAILHADIQGKEFDMLQGARRSLKREGIDYVFVSTHSQDLHCRCRDFLNAVGYVLMASADLQETYSCDGLLVFRRASLRGIPSIVISKRVNPPHAEG